MLAAAASIALLVGIAIWSQSPDYRVLYTNITEQDGGAIINALQQMNIPYQLSEGNGTILVPGTQVHEVRLRLASQGLPKGGISGFEILENQKFGSSQFLEQINYQRALEGELARSIQSLSAVQSARVHLAIAKPTVFVRERQQPSVSVLLNLYPGRVLTTEQVSAIIHLVSSSNSFILSTSYKQTTMNGVFSLTFSLMVIMLKRGGVRFL
jgi:flagellar M-ring protein FliF